MGRKESKGSGEDGPANQLIYLYDEEQFWASYRTRKGYVITREETIVQKTYEDMIMFMTDILPFTYNEIASFGYRQFFRSLKIAQAIAKAREKQIGSIKKGRRK